MAFYVVKKGGTATGDAGRYTSMPTGSFASIGASGYYDNIVAANAATTTPVDGDYVLISSIHSQNYGATQALGLIDGVFYVSMDDVDIERYLKGASEETTGGTYRMDISSTTNKGECYAKGIHFTCQATSFMLAGSDKRAFFYDCEFTDANNGYTQVWYTGNNFSQRVDYINCIFNKNTIFEPLYVNNGCSVRMNNIAVTGSPTKLLSSASSIPPNILIENSALSNMGVTPTVLLTPNNSVNLRVTNSLFPAGTTWIDGTADNRRISELSIDSVGVGVDDDNYHYYLDSPKYLGEAEEELAIYRTIGATYGASVGFCTKVTTEAGVSQLDPHRVSLGIMKIDTSLFTSTVTFTAHFARDGSVVALDSSKAWIELIYKDGDKKALGVLATSETDILATPNAPTTETGLWTGLSGTNIQMSVSKAVTIGTSTGEIASGFVEAFLVFAEPSTTIYACPQVDRV